MFGDGPDVKEDNAGLFPFMSLPEMASSSFREHSVGKSFGIRENQVQAMAPSFISCVTLDKSINVFDLIGKMRIILQGC